MARITIEDCMEKVPNRFELVRMASIRAKQLKKGARALIEKLPLEVKRRDYRVAWVHSLLGETELAAEFWRNIDARPVHSTATLTHWLYTLGGGLIWDLEWTPNFAARLEEMGVELEPFVLPPVGKQ